VRPRPLGPSWGATVKLRGRDWGAAFRRAPIGVLVIAALLFFVGAGFVIGAVVFALSGGGSGWVAWLSLLGAGPLLVYVALSFVLLRPRSWYIIVTLLGLLCLSSLARAVTAAEAPISPLVELVLQVLSIVYLTRPRVRRAFAVARR
jgi:hypothetical protein